MNKAPSGKTRSTRKTGPGRYADHVKGATGNGLLKYWKRYGFRGDSPGGLGPTPKGSRNPPRVLTPYRTPIELRWANATHERECARRLRQAA